MPQLDLTWFLFNSVIAWALVTLVLLSLSNQTWKNNTTTEHNPTSSPTPTNSWQW
uniref:ATP synthase F0 subunit 8 n=1 Tax=Holothuria leucospilota TaxID=206669 RepID=A0A6G7SAF5_HOLLE|nr:ATP synthase F0 subunit 8 [Holothuria leucospilota]QIJ98707.1 ATP synthase F0 subunit 8 [Holothuria leucospilota]QNN01420.1 ATP synthase F0 subunit 8 [Holothuria leucospilota]ULR86814.1 ATP synthase F0 subunit 8 [Holothuria leucospilota]